MDFLTDKFVYVALPIPVEVLDGIRGDQLHLDTVGMKTDQLFNKKRGKERGHYLDRSFGVLDLVHQFFPRPGADVDITCGIVEKHSFLL